MTADRVLIKNSCSKVSVENSDSPQSAASFLTGFNYSWRLDQWSPSSCLPSRCEYDKHILSTEIRDGLFLIHSASSTFMLGETGRLCVILETCVLWPPVLLFKSGFIRVFLFVYLTNVFISRLVIWNQSAFPVREASAGHPRTSSRVCARQLCERLKDLCVSPSAALSVRRDTRFCWPTAPREGKVEVNQRRVVMAIKGLIWSWKEQLWL